MHVPVMDRTPEEPPPFVVLVQGPPGVRVCIPPRHHFMEYASHASLVRLRPSHAPHFTAGRHHPKPYHLCATAKTGGVQPGSTHLGVCVTGPLWLQWRIMGISAAAPAACCTPCPSVVPRRATLTVAGTRPLSSRLRPVDCRRRSGSIFTCTAAL
jgi:hypothetical protein